MRNTLIALGAIGSLAAALAACGGGGSGTTPALSGGNAPQSVPTQFGVNNSTGPTGTMSVTIHIPQTGQRVSAATRAFIHATFGAKHADARIRSMANTAPSSVVRAMGARINTNGTLSEASRRGAQYVSPNTYYMEVVVTDSTNSQYIVDDTFYCSDTTCIGNVPVAVGTNYNVSLFLYDSYCGYLLSAGTMSGVNVTASATPVPVAITLNPVVDYFDVETTSSPAPFINDASEAQSFTITVTPLDANSNVETTPGVLLNSALQQITQVSLQVPVGGADLSSSTTQLLTVPTLSNSSPSPYGMTSTTYTFKGTSGDSELIWSAYPVTPGSPIIPAVATGTYGGGYRTSASYGELDEFPLPVKLIWTNPEGFPNPEGSPGYYVPSPSPSGNTNTFIPQFSQVGTSTWAFEFPNLNNGQGSGQLGVQEIVVQPSSSPYPIPFGGTVNFTDNGLCSGVFSYPSPGPQTYPSPPPSFGLIVNASAFNLASPNPGPSNQPCTVTATDNSPQARKAYLQVYYDSSSLTIQSRAGRTK
jgi:hypothetical protein